MGVSIKDVAKLSGVSIGTVSKFINGITVKEQNRQKIADAIDVLGYKVNFSARSLKTKKTMTVAILFDGSQHYFTTKLFFSLQEQLLLYGYHSILIDSGVEPVEISKKIKYAVEQGVDGIIVLSVSYGEELIGCLHTAEVPVVIVGSLFQEQHFDSILIDNLNATYHAIEQLIINAHRKIGIICGYEKTHLAEERLRGYKRVFHDYQTPFNDAYIKYSDYDPKMSYRCTNELLQMKDPPTAILATNYEATLGALLSIYDEKLSIPDDISFVGYNATEIAGIVRNGIAVVVQPIKEVGSMSAEILLQRMKGDYADFPLIIRMKSFFMPSNSIQKNTKKIGF